jgi:hypothetical protein
MLHLKPSVVVEGLQPEMYFVLGLADQAYADEGMECTVSAALDGVHNPGSLHPLGYAVDIGNRELTPGQHANIVSKLRRLEKYGFDVVDEGTSATAATTAQHFHVEFQPKAGESFWHQS